MKVTIFVLFLMSTILFSVQAETLVSGNGSVSGYFTPVMTIDNDVYNTVQPSSAGLSWAGKKVSEPAIIFLLGAGLIGIASTVRRKYKAVSG